MSYFATKIRAMKAVIAAVARIIRTVTGVPPITLTDCDGADSLVSLEIEGNSVQSGTPAPDTPIEVMSVGEKTVNLFDVSQLPVSGNGCSRNGNVIISTTYSAAMSMSPAKFLQITGLQEGDYYSVKVKRTLVGGVMSAASGRIGFVNSKTGYSAVYLVNSSSNPSTNTFYTGRIPTGFNNQNYYPYLYFYGANSASQGVQELQFSEIMIVKGTYTSGTMPEYEPYGYKLPVTVTAGQESETTDIYIGNTALAAGETVVIDAEAETIMRGNTDITALSRSLPHLYDGTTVIDVDTTVKPSSVTARYYAGGE